VRLWSGTIGIPAAASSAPGAWRLGEPGVQLGRLSQRLLVATGRDTFKVSPDLELVEERRR
jgi:hypothetical protein